MEVGRSDSFPIPLKISALFSTTSQINLVIQTGVALGIGEQVGRLKLHIL